MYIYDEYDRQIINDRVKQFRGQTERFLNGELAEGEFLPLRLQNGLYVQRLAPMLRICIPYGMLNSQQLRALAEITRKYDKGYAHFSTRQNIQLNWPKLEEVPDILADLAKVEMHAVQTSGNCIRNTTTDQFAGIAPDEVVDPRPWCELIRQWSTFHPEFAYLPRKFKIAVNAAEHDRAATKLHDIALEIVKNDVGEVGFNVMVGGGLGRTPVIAQSIKEFLPAKHLLTYLEAILRYYNQHGNRLNKYKARIKILVRSMGVEAFREAIDAEWQTLKDGPATLTDEEIARAHSFFTEPAYKEIDGLAATNQLENDKSQDRAFANWCARNVHAHKRPGYAAVSLSLKPAGVAPGDVTDKQLEAIADLADEFSMSEARSTHNQNVVLADVEISQLKTLWNKLIPLGFAEPNIGLLTDMICCPGGDYCALANAKSLPVAEAIQRRFDDIDYLFDLGNIDVNISGCMNACGHHHIGHIGILGVDKKGEEFYQICLGGNAGLNNGNQTSLGKILGPSFKQEDMPDVMTKILETYVAKRTDEESFLDTFNRIGLEPFKEAVYA